jgi:hypothetical protein
MKKERLNKIFKKWNDFVGWVGIVAFIITGILLAKLDFWLLKDTNTRITWLEGLLIIVGGIGICFIVYLVISFTFSVEGDEK